MTVTKRSIARKNRHDPTKSFVGFVVADVGYAVPIARVKEIVNPMAVVPVPHAPRQVVGVADYRGEIVPVVDLRVRFGLAAAALAEPASAKASKGKWVIVDVTGRLVALLVDAVTDVFGTGGTDLRATPTLGATFAASFRTRQSPSPSARSSSRAASAPRSREFVCVAIRLDSGSGASSSLATRSDSGVTRDLSAAARPSPRPPPARPVALPCP